MGCVHSLPCHGGGERLDIINTYHVNGVYKKEQDGSYHQNGALTVQKEKDAHGTSAEIEVHNIKPENIEGDNTILNGRLMNVNNHHNFSPVENSVRLQDKVQTKPNEISKSPNIIEESYQEKNNDRTISIPVDNIKLTSVEEEMCEEVGCASSSVGSAIETKHNVVGKQEMQLDERDSEPSKQRKPRMVPGNLVKIRIVKKRQENLNDCTQKDLDDTKPNKIIDTRAQNANKANTIGNKSEDANIKFAHSNKRRIKLLKPGVHLSKRRYKHRIARNNNDDKNGMEGGISLVSSPRFTSETSDAQRMCPTKDASRYIQEDKDFHLASGIGLQEKCIDHSLEGAVGFSGDDRESLKGAVGGTQVGAETSWAPDKKTSEDTCIDNASHDGQSFMECACCFTDVPLSLMAQCPDGHLFCIGCLTGYVKEAVYGQGRLLLTCMELDCDEIFTTHQLEATIPADLLKKYEKRTLEESLNIANIEGLVKCPFCEYAAIIPENMEIFQCENPTCLKKSCRLCEKSWEGHEEKPCDQMDNSETKLRTYYEEQMTQLKLRLCPRCKTSFIKQDGCNKMVCRCGLNICYICRKTKIGYMHFCYHPRDPNSQIGCTKCTKCSLWTNQEYDELLARRELNEMANRQRKAKGHADKKLIGDHSPEIFWYNGYPYWVDEDGNANFDYGYAPEDEGVYYDDQDYDQYEPGPYHEVYEGAYGYDDYPEYLVYDDEAGEYNEGFAGGYQEAGVYIVPEDYLAMLNAEYLEENI